MEVALINYEMIPEMNFSFDALIVHFTKGRLKQWVQDGRGYGVDVLKGNVMGETGLGSPWAGKKA